MKKRIASLCMAVVMLLSLCTGFAGAAGSGIGGAAKFTDLGETRLIAEIDTVVSAGLYQGTTATTFNPQGAMTRGAFVLVLSRLEGLDVESVPTTTTFTDVPSTSRFAGAIAWAAANGVAGGYSDQTFRPAQAITRAQIAALVQRYISTFKNYNLSTVSPAPAQFTDYAMTPNSLRTGVDYCRTHGLMQGFSDHSLRPNIPVTRAQVAAILARLLHILAPDTAADAAQSEAYTLNPIGNINGNTAVTTLERQGADGTWSPVAHKDANGNWVSEDGSPVTVQPGDRVILESGTKGVVGAAVLVYLLPVLLFFAGYAAGAAAGLGQGLCILTSLVGVVLGAALVVLLGRRHKEIVFRIVGFQR